MILPGLINEITIVNCPKNNCDFNLYLQIHELFDYTIAYVLNLIDGYAISKITLGQKVALSVYLKTIL